MLNLGHVHMKSTSELESFSLNDDAKIDQLVFKKMNSLVLHNYKRSCVIYFLNHDVSELMKSKLTI